jgi:ankyrin repeat protein
MSDHCVSCDINKVDANGDTALHINAAHDYVGICTALLKAGAKVNILNNKCQTPLIIAITKGYIELVKLFLEYNADINMRPCNNMLAIFVAIDVGNLEMFKLLFQEGADMKCKGPRGMNVLHYAAFKCETRMCEIAIDAGVDVNLTTDTGRTVLHNLALGTTILPELKSKSFYEKSCNISKLLLNKGANLNAVDSDGNTPCHLIGCGDNVKLMEFCVRNGANRTITNKQGKSPGDCYSIRHMRWVMNALTVY